MTIWSLDSQLGHSSAQRAGVDPENAGRTSGPTDPPTQIIKYPNNVIALVVIEGFDRRRQGLHFFYPKIFLDLQNRTAQINDRALDDIRQLSNITWPGI